MIRSITQNLNQERIVLTTTIVVFLAAAIWLPGFIAIDNLVAIARSVVVLSVLALGIIGRGIDLSMVAVMAMSVAWYLQLINDGGTDPSSFLKMERLSFADRKTGNPFLLVGTVLAYSDNSCCDRRYCPVAVAVAVPSGGFDLPFPRASVSDGPPFLPESFLCRWRHAMSAPSRVFMNSSIDWPSGLGGCGHFFISSGNS